MHRVTDLRRWPSRHIAADEDLALVGGRLFVYDDSDPLAPEDRLRLFSDLVDLAAARYDLARPRREAAARDHGRAMLPGGAAAVEEEIWFKLTSACRDDRTLRLALDLCTSAATREALLDHATTQDVDEGAAAVALAERAKEHAHDVLAALKRGRK